MTRAREIKWGPDVLVGAAELHRLRDAKIGADRWNPGCYAVYFYDEDGVEILSAGRFASVHAAGEAVRHLQVEAIFEEVAQHDLNGFGQ
jgi:hypothetical protein